MATTGKTNTKADKANPEGLEAFISGVGDQSRGAIDAVQQFVDTVNDAFPDIGSEGLRSQIINSAFAMTRQVVDASSGFAAGIVASTGRTIEGLASPEATETK